MILEVEKIPKSNTILIPVAGEIIKKSFESASDIGRINCGERTFKVFDFFVQEKNELYQKALFQLALGINVDFDKLWKVYSKSQRIFLFVCIEDDEKPKRKKEERNIIPSLDL